jgi:hypothetical protein
MSPNQGNHSGTEQANESASRPNKKVGSRIDPDLFDLMKKFVLFVNEGTYKNRLGDTVEDSFERTFANHFSANREELERFRHTPYADVDDDDIEKVKEFMSEYADEISAAADEIAQDSDTAQSAQESIPFGNNPNATNIDQVHEDLDRMAEKGPTDTKVEELEEKVDQLSEIVIELYNQQNQ